MLKIDTTKLARAIADAFVRAAPRQTPGRGWDELPEETRALYARMADELKGHLQAFGLPFVVSAGAKLTANQVVQSWQERDYADDFSSFAHLERLIADALNCYDDVLRTQIVDYLYGAGFENAADAISHEEDERVKVESSHGG